MAKTTTFTQLLETGSVLVADGGMGTSLFALGLGNGECPELLNIDNPQMVETAHRGFIDAGADIVLTNTFGGTRRRLALHGAEGRVGELNAAAVDVLRSAISRADRPIALAGSVGPTGDLLIPLGPLSYDDAVAAFCEQTEALADAGVDVIWIETMSSIDELRAAHDAASRVGLPIVTTMSFDTNGKTMMGVSPTDLATWGRDAGVHAIGGNCGIGLGDVVLAVHEMSAATPEATIVAKANAGIPAYTAEGGLTYPAQPLDMSAYASLAVRAGARIVGACCGSTPAHLTEIRRTITDLEGRRPGVEEIVKRLGATTPPVVASGERGGRRRSRRRTETG
jgi:5-methyltetrahydrofolate--homocysteine methyltransferase